MILLLLLQRKPLSRRRYQRKPLTRRRIPQPLSPKQQKLPLPPRRIPPEQIYILTANKAPLQGGN